MSITCILHGSFEDLLADASEGNEIQLSTAIATSARAVFSHFKIDTDLIQHVILDGRYIYEADWDTPLASGATLRIWPRIAGG